MPNPLHIADAADLVDLSIQDIFIKSADNDSQLYKKYYNIVDGVSDYYSKDSSLTGLGYAGRIVEGAAITAASPVQGYDKTYTQVRFGVVMSFTWENWKFGIKKRSLESITQQARQACANLRERRCADRLDQSHATSYTASDISGSYSVTTTGGDGLAMFTASHTREDGGTNWNNVLYDATTYNMDFEYDALKAAHRTASLIKDGQGLPMNVNLNTFVCSRGESTTHFRAIEMLGAMRKGWQPATADREGSGVPDYEVIALPWINSNTTYYWMFDSGMKNSRYGLQYKESQPISLDGPNVVFKTDEIQYKAFMAFDIGFNDARGWVGSKATNAA